ncbi:MAG TPA: PA0069 family radical SAM protein [Verrucomicrobiae bacterium]|jgi:DNA repair photolyase|nr:PA0069 family radical SAM protein [Verrucomicrobiae bacterium]
MKPVQNPPNPFLSDDCQYLDGMTPPAKLEVFFDRTRNILSKNDSPDLGFKWSLNPYRGCMHACAYCYARPTHEYLGFGAGTDFETKIVAKPRAAELLRETFMKRSWKGELIVFSGDTDCYQPLEAHYRLTRACLEVCLEFGNPAAIITKSFLVTRDLELLKNLHERTHVSVTVSIPFFSEKTARIVEPGAASVSKRFEAVKLLADAGIEVSVNIAPVIPGLSDSDIPQILKRAKECGAQSAAMVLLRLPGHVKEVFIQQMKTHFPLAADKIIGRLRETRGGELYRSEFGERFRGKGDYWDNIRKMFDTTCARLGLNRDAPESPRPPFQRPGSQKEFTFA